MNRRVLFVDDEPEMLSGIRRNLRKDFEVHTETDPRKALAMLNVEQPFAVIVADIAVAGMSCQNCADKIDAALSQLDGVKAVEVNLKEGVAQVKYDAALVTVPAMQQSITKLGYSIGKTGAAAPPWPLPAESSR